MAIQILVGTFLAILAVDVVLRIVYGRKALAMLDSMPPFNVVQIPPQKQATLFEAVTDDGVTLRGSIYHSEGEIPQGVIIFCPETLANHWSAVRYCQGLMDAGYIVVSFDFRNQGESDHYKRYEPLHWVSEFEVKDLHTIVNWVKDQESFADLPLGVFGVSRGGATALKAARNHPDIEYVCADSCYTNYLLVMHYVHRRVRLIVPEWIIQVRRTMWHATSTVEIAFFIQQFRKGCRYLNSSEPFTKMKNKHVMLIAGKNDSYVPVTIAERIQEMLGKQCETLWIVPKVAHNGARAKYPEEYDQMLVTFFSQMPTLEPVISTEMPVNQLTQQSTESLISN